MTAGSVAALCVAVIVYGCIRRFTQLVLWILNGRRS